jgi:hypothetical protein
MTYSELLALLSEMPPDALTQTATVYDSGNDEYYPINSVEIAVESQQNVLDDGHYYLEFNN